MKPQSLIGRFVLALLLVCTFASARAEFSDVVLLRSGEGGYHTYRIPAAVTTRDGKVVLLAEGRKESTSDFGAIDLISLRSDDGGVTWSKPQVVWSEGAAKAKISVGNPAPVYDESTGRLWCVFTKDNQRVFVTSTDDSGATWARPKEITAEVRPIMWMRYWTGPGHGLQLKHGSHAGRLLVPSFHFALEVIENGNVSIISSRCHSVYSDDHGQTWKIGESTALAPELADNPRRRFSGTWIPGEARWHGSESMVEELDDGRLMLMSRDEAHYDQRKGIAWSSDGGETWSPMTLSADLPCTRCQASLIRWTDPKNPAAQDYLVSAITIDNRQPKGAGGGAVKPSLDRSALIGRQRLVIFTSHDACRTWKEARVIHPEAAAYSDLVVLPDGRILCFYEGGKADAYESIRLARFDRAWLESE